MNSYFKLEAYKEMDEKKPKKQVVELICIGMIYFAIEMAFSIEIALAVPILVTMRVSEKYALCHLLLITFNLLKFSS